MSIQSAIDYFGTQTALAKACGIKPQTVNRWTKGLSNPSVKNMQKIEQATNGAVTKEQLFAEVCSSNSNQPTSDPTTPP